MTLPRFSSSILLLTSICFILLLSQQDYSQNKIEKNSALINLGKKLFFDTILSGNNQISCATCHQPAAAFTDNLALSNLGASKKKLFRNTPTLIYVAHAKTLFWDGGAKNLESQAFAPITNPNEMNQNMGELLQELENHQSYPVLFQQIFLDKKIHTAYILRALAAYQRTILPIYTKYDTWFYANLLQKMPIFCVSTADTMVQKGYQIFLKNCESCHTLPLFTDNDFHSNQIDSIFIDSSNEQVKLGRFRITHNITDIGKFKTPTLRNLSRTAPYMHDGRFATITEVVAHYALHLNKIKFPYSQKIPNQKQITQKLSVAEKQALIAFLEIL